MTVARGAVAGIVRPVPRAGPFEATARARSERARLNEERSHVR